MNILFNKFFFILAFFILMIWTSALAISKNDMSRNEFAVHFFNKQAKLDICAPTDKDYSILISPSYDEKKQSWGYVDEKGKWIIKPTFDDAEPFKEDDCAFVKWQGFWGIINRSRGFVCPPIFKEVRRSSVENVFMASCPIPLWNEYTEKQYDKKRIVAISDQEIEEAPTIILNSSGDLLFEDLFISVNDFDRFNNAIAKNSEGYIIVKSDGDYLMKDNYDQIEIFGDSGLYKICSDGMYGLLSYEGKMIQPARYSQMDNWSASDLIWIKESKTNKWGLIDSRGQVVVNTIFDFRETLHPNSCSVVTSNGKFGLLSGDGSFVKECEDDYIVNTSVRLKFN